VLGNIDEMGFDLAEKAEIVEIIISNHQKAKDLRDYLMISLTLIIIASFVVGTLGVKVSSSLSSVIGKSLIAVGFFSIAISIASIRTFFKYVDLTNRGIMRQLM
jgi:hypothetical protein